MSQEKTVEAFRDWSKWMIGVDFVAGAGCVAVLRGGVGDAVRPWLVAAIIAFALAAMVSALLVRMLVSLTEHLPCQSSSNKPASISDYGSYLSIGRLSHIQLALTFAGVFCLLGWVYNIPAASTGSASTDSAVSTQDTGEPPDASAD